MSPRQPRHFRLPGGITVTVVRLHGRGHVGVLRAAAHASLYLLYGETTTPPIDVWDLPTRTGPGFYVGMSAALRDELRAGVSLYQWATARERLDPQLAILIDRPGRPLDPRLLRFIETQLTRQLWLDWTLLNTVSGCPTASARLTRTQVRFGLWLTRRLLHLLHGRVLPRDLVGTPTGGPIREQLVRLVRARGPLTTAEIAAAGHALGLPIARHGDPGGTIRRDLATREAGSRGPTRVRRTHIPGSGGRSRTLFYPPEMSRAEAVRAWRIRHQLPVGRPPRRPSSARP